MSKDYTRESEKVKVNRSRKQKLREKGIVREQPIGPVIKNNRSKVVRIDDEIEVDLTRVRYLKDIVTPTTEETYGANEWD